MLKPKKKKKKKNLKVSCLGFYLDVFGSNVRAITRWEFVEDMIAGIRTILFLSFPDLTHPYKYICVCMCLCICIYTTDVLQFLSLENCGKFLSLCEKWRIENETRKRRKILGYSFGVERGLVFVQH